MSQVPDAHGEAGAGSPVFAAAIRYVERHKFSVIPVGSDKRPTIPTWEPYQRRRPTLEEMEKWFADGRANVAVVTGEVSGIVVVDVDAHHGGEETVRNVKFPRTPTTLTPHGGRHLYFSHEPGTHVGTRRDVVPGVDIRGDGGYAVLPPSIADGKAYEFAPSLSLDDVPFGEPSAIPAAWLNGKRVPVPRQLPETLYDGQERWRHLTSLAGTLRNRGFIEGEIVEQLAVFNRNRCRPPKASGDLRRIAAWVVAHDSTADLRESLPRSTGVTLSDVREAFSTWLYLPDPLVVDVGLATYAAHRLPGDPLWTQLVGASGSGKTEVVAALGGMPEVRPLSKLTAQTFISGMKGKKAASLLLRMDERGESFMTLKDFTTILTMRSDDRQQIIGQLRELYDGSYRGDWGTGEEIVWEGRLGFLAGVTPVIDSHRAVTSVLGERFVYYRLPAVDRARLGEMALAKRGSEREMREALRETVAGFLAGLDYTPPGLSVPAGAAIVGLADFTTLARSGVERDGYTREILALPDPEAPTRYTKQLAALTEALIVMGHTEPEALAVALRVARDSVPGNRRAVLRVLRVEGESKTSDVVAATGLPKMTTFRTLEDLAALRLVVQLSRQRDNEGITWRLADETAATWSTADPDEWRRSR